MGVSGKALSLRLDRKRGGDSPSSVRRSWRDRLHQPSGRSAQELIVASRLVRLCASASEDEDTAGSGPLVMLWTAFPPARKCHWSDRRWGGRGYGEPSMQAITTVGLDIAKSVFQVHGVDAAGEGIIRRQLKRRHVLPFFEKLPACVVGMEACATSHHWSRELRALGHTVRLMPPAYVKPYVKRRKKDAADAEAICEAVTRANIRFVETKTPEQQACLMLHRTRHLFIRQQTSVINAIRAHMAEYGIVARVGRNGVAELLA